MEGETSNWLNEDYLSYIFMLLIYSGLGSWLVARFTRDRTELRRERRVWIRENLELMEKLAQLREVVPSPERKSGLDQMWSRLLDETTARIEELNMISGEESHNPARHYLILPTPRTPFTVFVSLIFAFCLYVSIGALLMLGVAFISDGGYDPLRIPDDMDWTLKLLGLSVGALILAFGSRLLAYRLYNKRTMAMRHMPAAAD